MNNYSDKQSSPDSSITPFDNAASPALLHLRPHHLLCLQTFVGHGYSESFVRQMTLVKKQLTIDPSTPIELVEGADDLCRHCPNLTKGTCSSDKPAKFDELVMRRLSSEDQHGSGHDIRRTIPGALPEGPDALPEAPVAMPEGPGALPESSVMLRGIPVSLQVSGALIDECCPDCEWNSLCRDVCTC